MPRKDTKLPLNQIDPERSIEDQLDDPNREETPVQTLDEWLNGLVPTACDPKDAGAGCNQSLVVDRETYYLAKDAYGSDDFTRVWLPGASQRTIILQDEETGAHYPGVPNDGSVTPLTDPIEGHTYLAPTSETKTDAENRGNKTGRGKGRKPKEEPVARTFSNADPAERIGKLLIADHYPELSHQPIRYIFTSVADTVGGEPVICRPTKLSGFAAWLAAGGEDGEASPTFVVLISQTHWDSMPQKGREAFLDTALSQFKVTKSGALKMGQLDIRESSAVLARHGMYSKKLKDQARLLQTALAQPALELAS